MAPAALMNNAAAAATLRVAAIMAVLPSFPRRRIARAVAQENHVENRVENRVGSRERPRGFGEPRGRRNLDRPAPKDIIFMMFNLELAQDLAA
jgi:hypothetical protein